MLGRVDVGPVLEDERAVADRRVFEDGEGLRAVGPAAAGERRVGQRDADVVGDDGVEAQRLVERVLQVAHGFEVLVGGLRGGVGAEGGVDFAAERGDDVGVLGEGVEEPGEGHGGCVAAREEDGDQLVAQHGAVARVGGQRVQEGVALVGLGFGFEFRGREREGLVDVLFDEGVEDFQALVEAFLGHEGLRGASAGDDGLHVLDFSESVRELGLGVLEAVDAVAEEEVGGGVEGEAEEEVVDADRLAGEGAFEFGQENLDVGFEGVQVGDAVFDELGSDQLAGVVPEISVGGENAWTRIVSSGSERCIRRREDVLKPKKSFHSFLNCGPLP